MRAIRRYSAITAVFFGFFALSQCVAGEVSSGRTIDAATALAGQPGAPSRIPVDAKAGTIEEVAGRYVVIDGQQFLLAPGGWIRGKTNLIVMPGAVELGTLIFYRLDAQGQVLNAWIPTREEADARKTNNWSFSLGAEKL